jgi:hypothetical protein
MKRALILLALTITGATAIAQSSYCYNYNIGLGEGGLSSVCMTMVGGVQACNPRFAYNEGGQLNALNIEYLSNLSVGNYFRMWEDDFYTTPPQIIIEVVYKCIYDPNDIFGFCLFDSPEVWPYANVLFGNTAYQSPVVEQDDYTVTEILNGEEVSVNYETITYTIPLAAANPTYAGSQSEFLKVTSGNLLGPQTPWNIAFEFGTRITVFGDDIIGDPQWTTQAPTLPTLILRDPPGDQSFAYLEENSTTCHGYGMSIGSTNSTEAWASVKLGASGSVGIIAETEYEVYAEISGGLEIGMTRTSAEEYELCYSTTTGYQTNPENGLVGDGDDVFIGTATNYAYGMYRTFFPPAVPCSLPQIRNELILSPVGTTNTIVFTQDHILNNVIPGIQQNLAGLDPSSAAYETLSDQLEVWQQAVAINEELKAEAEFTTGTSFVGGPALDESVSLTTSEIKSIEMNMYIDAFVAAEIGAEVNGTGASGGVRVRARTDQGSTSFSSNQNTNTVGYHLQDDDMTDSFSLDILTDKAFGTPVFVLDEQQSQSSCPYEGGFQIDQPVPFIRRRFGHPDPGRYSDRNTAHLPDQCVQRQQPAPQLQPQSQSGLQYRRSHPSGIRRESVFDGFRIRDPGACKRLHQSGDHHAHPNL